MARAKKSKRAAARTRQPARKGAGAGRPTGFEQDVLVDDPAAQRVPQAVQRSRPGRAVQRGPRMRMVIVMGVVSVYHVRLPIVRRQPLFARQRRVNDDLATHLMTGEVQAPPSIHRKTGHAAVACPICSTG